MDDIYLYEDEYANGEEVPTVSSFRAPPGSWISDIFFFGQHTWTATWWLELTGGLRIDSYNYSGLFYSPRAGVLMVPANGATIKLLYGRAFRAPSARELLVQVQPDELGTVPFTNGNPDLLPESIDTIDALTIWHGCSVFNG